MGAGITRFLESAREEIKKNGELYKNNQDKEWKEDGWVEIERSTHTAHTSNKIKFSIALLQFCHSRLCSDFDDVGIGMMHTAK